MEEEMKVLCNDIRSNIEVLKGEVAGLHDHSDFHAEDTRLPGQCPESKKANMHANITLAFRHLEDARMRLGKVIQASEGGVSCYDKKES